MWECTNTKNAWIVAPWAKKSSADARLKAGRKAKGWTQEYLAQLVDLTPRSIMYIENKGQHTSLNAFYKLVTLLDISVDEFFYPNKLGNESERRKHINRLLNSMDERELVIMETVAEGIEKSRTGAK